MTIKPSDYQQLAKLARKAGYALRGTARPSERFEIRRWGSDEVYCTFTDLDGVRDWLLD